MYGFYIDEDRRKARRAKWNTVRIISIGFFGVILLGSLLLWLPFSNHQPIRYIDALFTAVTCVCVTGLVTVVPAAQFTVAGKVILLILIQIGGLGIIACTTAFLILVGKRINMKERVVIQEAYGLSTLQGMIRFIERVLWGTFLVEGIGAIGYSFQFIPEYGVAKGIFYSVFHSISAFCNAGVDILGDSSFTRYVNTPVITITTTMLVILSGLGYPVWIDLAKNIKMTIQSKGKRPVGRTITRLSLQSKIVLTMTLFLLTLGTVGFYLLEHHNPATMGTLNAAGKFQAAFFQSVTTRTAGFASISQSGLTNWFEAAGLHADDRRWFTGRNCRWYQDNNSCCSLAYSDFCLERKQRYGMLWKKNYIRNYKSSDNNHTCDICFLAVWGDGDDSDRATAESP